MADLKTYRVLRPMQGDRDYAVGDTRQLTATDAQQLVSLGVLEEVAGKASKAKADRPLKNKAAGQ